MEFVIDDLRLALGYCQGAGIEVHLNEFKWSVKFDGKDLQLKTDADLIAYAEEARKERAARKR